MDELKQKIKESIESFEQAIPNVIIRKQLNEEVLDWNEHRISQDKFIKQLRFRLKAKANKDKQNDLLHKAATYFQEALSKGLDKPVAYMNGLIANNRVQFQFSRLEKMSEDQIKEIIKDQNLIEIIEMFENESKGQQ